MQIDPSRYSVLLVGPRVHRLGPFFVSRGYQTTPCATGADALRALRAAPVHLVMFELDVEDLDARQLLAQARALQPNAGYLLLDDPARTGLIVSTFVAGADSYFPTPPNEQALFECVARLVLAAAARGGGRSEVEQLEAALRAERASKDLLAQEIERLEGENRVLVAALEEEKKARAAAPPPAKGAGGMSEEELADLRSRAEFVTFLESENDELKKERDALLERLQELGAAEDLSSEFDEKTGESDLGEEVLSLEE